MELLSCRPGWRPCRSGKSNAIRYPSQRSAALRNCSVLVSGVSTPSFPRRREPIPGRCGPFGNDEAMHPSCVALGEDDARLSRSSLASRQGRVEVPVYTGTTHAGCDRHTKGMKMAPPSPVRVDDSSRGLDSGVRRNDGCGRLTSISYQSLMPVVTGTPRDENGRRVLGCSIVRGSDRGTGFRLGCRNDGCGRLTSIFVPIAHAGCDRHTKGMKMASPVGMAGATLPQVPRGSGRHDRVAGCYFRTNDGGRLSRTLNSYCPSPGPFKQLFRLGVTWTGSSAVREPPSQLAPRGKSLPLGGKRPGPSPPLDSEHLPFLHKRHRAGGWEKVRMRVIDLHRSNAPSP